MAIPGATRGTTIPKRTHLLTQEGALGHKGRWGNTDNVIREMRCLLRLSPGSAPWAKHYNQHHRGAVAWSTSQSVGCHCSGYGTQSGMQGKSISGLHKNVSGNAEGRRHRQERGGIQASYWVHWVWGWFLGGLSVSPHVCVGCLNVSPYPQPEWRCSLRAPMSMCKQLGCRKQLLGRLSDPGAHWGETYGVRVHIYIPTRTFSPWTARREQGEAVGAVCVSVSAACVCADLWGQLCVYVYVWVL